MRLAVRRSMTRSTLAALVLLATLTGVAWSEDSQRVDLEREVWDALARGEDVSSLVEAVRRTAPPRVRPPVSQEASRYASGLAGLRKLGREPSREALAARLEAVQALDLLYEARLEDVSRKLSEAGAAPEILARQEAAEAAYREVRSRLLGPLEAILSGEPSNYSDSRAAALEASLSGLEAAIAQADPPILRSHALPFGPAGLPPRSPVTEPAVVASYGRPDPLPPTAADSGESPLVPRSEVILQEAEALGYDPLRIYEFVRDRIAGEWYAGAWKGAEETLRQGRGNDVDKTLLLAALLRASSVPCRFVVGVAERPVGDLAFELGLEDASRVPEALTRAGIAHRPVIRGGVVAAVEIEQTWLAAFVAYGNYRGAVVDLSGDTWIPLAPSVQHSRREPSAALLRAMGLDIEAWVEGSLGSVHSRSPLAELRDAAEAFLTEGTPYESQLGGRFLEDWPIGLLPSSLPFRVVAETYEGSALPESLIAHVRFRAEDEAGETILSAELPLAALTGHRLTYSASRRSGGVPRLGDRRPGAAFGTAGSGSCRRRRIRGGAHPLPRRPEL